MKATTGSDADWLHLWRLAQRLSARAGEDPAYTFMAVGLGLEDPGTARAWEYDTTPLNCLTFASTGGDGVHFSIITGDGTNIAAGAVVMTAPMAFDSPNHILGGSLREFLALGSCTGYFSLDSLAYSWGRQEAIAELQAAVLPDFGPEGALLRRLTDEFGLQPWSDVARRLDELDTMYQPKLRLRPGS